MIDPSGDALPAGVTARLGSGRLMHAHLVSDIVFSPDGTKIASCAEDVRLWDATSGELLHRWREGAGSFVRLAFAPDGKSLAAVSQGATLWRWSVASGELVHRTSLDRHEGRALAYAGERLVVVGAYTKVLVFTAKGKRLCVFEQAAGWVKDLVCDPARGRVYVATERDLWRFALPAKGLLSWAAPDASAHRQLRSEGGHAVALSADGRRLLTSDYEKVTVWSIGADGEECVEREFAARGQAERISLSPDGERLLSAGRDGAQLWSVEGTLLRTFAENHYGVDVAVYSPSGERLATGARGGDVRIWDADGAAEVISFPRNRSHIESLAISPDASRVVTVSGVKTLHVWDGVSGVELCEVAPDRDTGTQVAFSPTGAVFAHARDDGRVSIYDPEGAPTGMVLSTPGRSGWFRSLAISPDGAHLVGCRGDRELLCWTLGDARLRWTKALEAGHYGTLRFSPDGKHLAACDGNSIMLWDFPSGQALCRLGEAVVGMGFVDDHTVVGFCSDGFVRTWNLDRGEVLAQHWYDGGAAVVSPTGTVAAFQREEVTEFRALPRLELLGSLPTGNWGYGATFSADGTRFIGAHEARCVLIWDIGEIVAAPPGPTPVYPGAAALAAYKLILNTVPTERFQGVRLGDGCTHAASPEQDDFDFLGIVINLPAQGRVLSSSEQEAGELVLLDPPVSPLVPMAGQIMEDGAADIHNIYVVAIDAKTGQRFRGRLELDRPTRAQIAREPIYDDDFGAMDDDDADGHRLPAMGRTGSWFTVNLSEQLGLPDRPGVYRVHLEHAVVESLRSNEVRVEIA